MKTFEEFSKAFWEQYNDLECTSRKPTFLVVDYETHKDLRVAYNVDMMTMRSDEHPYFSVIYGLPVAIHFGEDRIFKVV